MKGEENMEDTFKTVTLENLESEHICCMIAEKKGENCVAFKKAWMRERIAEGLVFLKLEVRGKVFIEYIPAEYAWCPIEADDYMFINCLWVSGQYKGKGYGSRLLEQCIADSREKGKKGLVVISSPKKLPFLSDPKFLKQKGFLKADEAKPHFELLYLPFYDEGQADIPKFRETAKSGTTKDEGWVLYYTNQCPHTEKYAPVLADCLKKHGEELKIVKFETRESILESPSPFTTYALFYDGAFVTNEVLSEKSFEKIWNRVKGA